MREVSTLQVFHEHFESLTAEDSTAVFDVCKQVRRAAWCVFDLIIVRRIAARAL